jgi:hypothetical protein
VMTLVDNKRIFRDRARVEVIRVQQVDEFCSSFASRVAGNKPDIVRCGARSRLSRSTPSGQCDLQ